MPLTVIFVIGLFVSLYLGALFHPVLGVLSYIVVYLIYDPSLWWCRPIAEILTRPSLVAVIAIVVGCALHPDKLNWRITKREVVFYLFCGTMWIVAYFFGVGVYTDTAMVLEKMTKMYVFIFLFLRIVHTQNALRLFILGIIFGGFFIAFQAHEIGQFSGARLDGMGGIDFRESNALAMFMACATALAGFEMLRQPWKIKIPMIIAIALMLDTLVLTRSRGGFLALVVAFPYVMIAIPKRFRKQVNLYALLGALMFSMLVDDYFLGRMDTIDQAVTTGKEYDSKEVLSRLDFWRASVWMFQDNPMGVGPNNFETAVSRYDPRIIRRDAHSTYVTCYSENGILGILIFLYIVGSGFVQIRNARKLARSNPKGEDASLYGVGICSALIALTVGGMPTHTYLYQEISWILLALPICYENAVLALVQEWEEPENEATGKEPAVNPEERYLSPAHSRTDA